MGCCFYDANVCQMSVVYLVYIIYVKLVAQLLCLGDSHKICPHGILFDKVKPFVRKDLNSYSRKRAKYNRSKETINFIPSPMVKAYLPALGKQKPKKALPSVFRD